MTGQRSLNSHYFLLFVLALTQPPVYCQLYRMALTLCNMVGVLSHCLTADLFFFPKYSGYRKYYFTFCKVCYVMDFILNRKIKILITSLNLIIHNDKDTNDKSLLSVSSLLPGVANPGLRELLPCLFSNRP